MAKLTLADIKRRGGRVNRARVQATTATEIDQQAREDGTERGRYIERAQIYAKVGC